MSRRNESAFPKYERAGDCEVSTGGVTIGELLTAIVVSGLIEDRMVEDERNRAVRRARDIVYRILSDGKESAGA